ncbi:MAG: protein kinase [Phycisphaeraceae bacterium]|nr:protein kinase [Phycisphaeraceae bacterium]
MDEREQQIASAVCEVIAGEAAGQGWPIARIEQHWPGLGDAIERKLVAARGMMAVSASACALAGPSCPGYELLSEIGCGGQAVVYHARHLATGRDVALKMLAIRAGDDSIQVRRLQREAAILAKLNHPHIVKIIDIGTASQGRMFFAMDYIEGRNLYVHAMAWRLDHPHSETAAPELLTLFAKVCRAVHEAHLAGVIHRDLKPDNILVDAAGQPRLLDFGLAIDRLAMHPALTQTLDGLGTLLWSSPEHLAGDAKQIDARSDVYSLGVMLYQILAGELPYDKASPKAMLRQLVSADWPPLSRIAQVSPRVDKVVRKALAGRPKDRYADAGSLADAVMELVAKPRLRQGRRRPYRRWAAWSLVMVMLLIAVGFTCRAIWQRMIAPPAMFVVPDRAINFSGHAYLLVYSDTTYQDACEKAARMGGRLAQIDSTGEFRFLFDACVLPLRGKRNSLTIGSWISEPKASVPMTWNIRSFLDWPTAHQITFGSVKVVRRTIKSPFIIEWSKTNPHYQPPWTGGIIVGDRAFKLLDYPMSFAAARSNCSQISGIMAEVDSVELAEKLRTLAPSGRYWVGGHPVTSGIIQPSGHITPYENVARLFAYPKPVGDALVYMEGRLYTASGVMEMTDGCICEWNATMREWLDGD